MRHKALDVDPFSDELDPRMAKVLRPRLVTLETGKALRICQIPHAEEELVRYEYALMRRDRESGEWLPIGRPFRCMALSELLDRQTLLRFGQLVIELKKGNVLFWLFGRPWSWISHHQLAESDQQARH